MIDLHAHFLLPEYVAAAERAGHLRPDGMPGWPEWSVQKHLAEMDRTGIDKAVLSVPSPGVHFGDDFRAQVLARRVNEAAAKLGRDHPGRFGFFASLPLPDVEGAVVEVDYAYDVLHADGVVLLSNAGGMYPGDPSWEPLWRALDARSAMVLVHPTSPPQWRQVALDRPRPMIEFPFDTARAVADLALTGVLTRYPGIRFVVAHGDLLPFLSERIDLFQGTSTVAGQLKNLSYISGSGYCCAAQSSANLTVRSCSSGGPTGRDAGFEPVPGRAADDLEATIVEMSTGSPAWTVVYGTSCGSAEGVLWMGPFAPPLSAPGNLVIAPGRPAACVDVLVAAFG